VGVKNVGGHMSTGTVGSRREGSGRVIMADWQQGQRDEGVMDGVMGQNHGIQ